MRYTGPKNRLARRQGADLGLKTVGSKSHARLLKKLNVLPGQHGTRGRRKTTEYGIQLKEKQKLRFMFGITESQQKRYYKAAVKKKGNTALHLTKSLEARLDNVVFRLGFAPTRAAARQLVNHGHFKVNDKIVTIPSFQTKINEIISFTNDKSAKIPYIEKNLNNKDIILPTWLERKATVGKIISEPDIDDIKNLINLRLVVEYYSR